MAHLLIVDLPGGNDTDLLAAALERGDSFVFLTSELALYEQQPPVKRLLDMACAVLEVPGFDDEAVQKAALMSHRAKPFQAVLCLIDLRIVAAARLAQRLGLPHLNAKSAALLRDKAHVRLCLQARGLTQPDHVLATNTEQLQTAVQQLGLPVLIKPCDGYGSQNIVVLRDTLDLDPFFNPLPDLLPSRLDYGLGVWANDRLLVERYMAGQFVGCDTFTSHGSHHLWGVHTKLMFAPPSFAIRGSTFQATQAQHEQLQRYVFAALDAVGFDHGAAHVEVMLTAQGPQLVEINPRLVGAKIARVASAALGRSLHAELIDLHLGLWAMPTVPPPPVATAIRWFTAPHAGVLEGHTPPTWNNHMVRQVEWLAAPGAKVCPPMQNAQRLGYVLAQGASAASAEALAERYVSDMHVHVRLEQAQHADA